MFCQKTRRILPFFLCLIFLLPIGIEAHAGSDGALEILQNETGYYYIVRKGDTLWDLSQKFLDSPWVWPDLWSQNNQIHNPHLIYPGDQLRLYRRADFETFRYSDGGKLAINEKDQIYYHYPSIDQIGFIRKTPVTPSGTIIEVKDQKVAISSDDIIYLRQKGGEPLTLGRIYDIYRVYDPLVEEETGQLIGYQHYFTGQAQVLELIENTAGGPPLAAARVIKSYRTIQLGDKVIPFVKRSPEIVLQPSVKNLDGSFLISEEHQVAFGDHVIAFIDKGANHGVEAGQCYSIYHNEKLDQTDYRSVFGTLLVLHAEPATATVVVYRSDKSVHTTSRFCTPFKHINVSCPNPFSALLDFAYCGQ